MKITKSQVKRSLNSLKKAVLPLLLIVVIMTFSIVCKIDRLSDEKDNSPAAQVEQDNVLDIAIAWHDDPGYSYSSAVATAQKLGGNVVILDMVRSYDLEYDKDGKLVGCKDAAGVLTPDAARLIKNNRWLNSNAEEVMEGIDCIIFPGGEDISPTLFYDEQDWHGLETDPLISAERDVSDYLLMSYCVDKDIPVLALCRGMQVLAIVSGAGIIQDIPAWYAEQGVKYNDLHRDPEQAHHVPHSVSVVKDSMLYDITGKETLDGVPSWHHQSVTDVENTRLKVTGTTKSQGLTVIEAVERTDRTFCIGVQYHPEIAVRKSLNNESDAGLFMDYDTAISLFEALADAGRDYMERSKDPGSGAVKEPAADSGSDKQADKKAE